MGNRGFWNGMRPFWRFCPGFDLETLG